MERVWSFLSNFRLPEHSSDSRIVLDNDITEDEIKQTILSLPNGKTPGPDGFSAEYYKLLQAKILPTLTFLNKIYKGDINPKEFHESRTILIAKPGRDPTLMSLYHPISLLNQDYKMYC